jgi:Spy/CpxP family protein refolding chaperone
MRSILKTIATFTLLAGLSLFGQATKGAWWSRPAIKDLNLSRQQMRDMRQTVQEYRPRLQDLRAAVQKAEQDLETEFNRDPVDTQKANAVIDRLVAARADLSRTLSQMGLKLRVFLTAQQWQEVEKRFPPKPAKQPGAN